MTTSEQQSASRPKQTPPGTVGSGLSADTTPDGAVSDAELSPDDSAGSGSGQSLDFEAAREMALLESHRAGDPQALEELLTSNEGRIYATCLKMCGNSDHARDLAQETFLRAIRGLVGFQGNSRVSTWLTRIAINVCLTDRRRRVVRQTGSLDAPLAGGADDAGDIRTLGESLPQQGEPTASERVEQEEAGVRLEEAMGRLEPEKRAMLLLRDGQDLDYATIAEVLGIPSGTVKSRLFRARVALRKELERTSRTDDTREVSERGA